MEVILWAGTAAVTGYKVTTVRKKNVMDPVDRHILEDFATRVRARFPGAWVWAFGSRARGDATWASDLDVCVVLDQPATREVKDWIGDVAWEAGFEANRTLNTLVFERRAIEEGPLSVSPLVTHILREGVAA
jgi:predicted nucleotidyltransferase